MAAARDANLPTSVKFGTAGLAGVLGWAAIHPFNTLAVRMNLSSSMPGYVKQSFPSFVAQTVRERGFITVYEGLGAGCIRQVFYATSRFGLFEVFRDKLASATGGSGPSVAVAAGLASGACAAFISCPAEVALVRMSNDATLPKEQQRGYTSFLNCWSRIAKEEGVQAFFRGCAPFVQRAMLVGVVQVGTFDQGKGFYDAYAGIKRGTYANVACASFTSGLLYSMATMPFERCVMFCARSPGSSGQRVDPGVYH